MYYTHVVSRLCNQTNMHAEPRRVVCTPYLPKKRCSSVKFAFKPHHTSESRDNWRASYELICVAAHCMRHSQGTTGERLRAMMHSGPAWEVAI